MVNEKRKKIIISAANSYSDTAINVGTAVASKDFFGDHLCGKWNVGEYVLLICLVQKYIDCKCGVISREDCIDEQNKLFAEWADWIS